MEDQKDMTEIKGWFDQLRTDFFSILKGNRMAVPYMGQDPSLYLLYDKNVGYGKFPIAEFDGTITLDRLRQVFDELNTDDLYMEPTENKEELFKKLYGVYLSLQFNDPAFEDKLKNSAALALEPSEETTPDNSDLSQDITIYEFAFDGSADQQELADNERVVRSILRTGTWKLSPSSKEEPLTITKEILDELAESFQAGAFEHVTVPETHVDRPLENCGFIRGVSVVPNVHKTGEWVLKGEFEFTRPEAKKAVLEGSVAGVSCGIVFKHERKSDGKVFPRALHHVALTNKPWIDGLEGWEKLAASEYDAQIILGLEEKSMSDLELTQDEIRAIVAENTRLKAVTKRSQVSELVRGYQAKNITPAVLAKAEEILLAAEVTPTMMTLSADNSEVSFNLAEAVKALLDAMPEGVDLSQSPVDPTHEKTPSGEEKKTPEEMAAEWRTKLGLTEVTAEDLQKLGA